MWRRIIIKKYLPYVILILVVSIILNLYLKLKISNSVKVKDFYVNSNSVFVLDSEGLKEYSINRIEKKNIYRTENDYNKIVQVSPKILLYSKSLNRIDEINKGNISKKYRIKNYLNFYKIDNSFIGVMADSHTIEILDSRFKTINSISLEDTPYYVFKNNNKIYYSIYKENIIKEENDDILLSLDKKDLDSKMTINNISIHKDKLIFIGINEDFKNSKFYIYDFTSKKLFESNMLFQHPASTQVINNKMFVLNKQNNEMYTYHIDNHKKIDANKISKIFNRYYSINTLFIFGFLTYILIIIAAFFIIVYFARYYFFKQEVRND